MALLGRFYVNFGFVSLQSKDDHFLCSYNKHWNPSQPIKHRKQNNSTFLKRNGALFLVICTNLNICDNILNSVSNVSVIQLFYPFFCSIAELKKLLHQLSGFKSILYIPLGINYTYSLQRKH